MDCYLMHGNVRVAEVSVDDASGEFLGLGEVLEEKRLPIGATDFAGLRYWWNQRAIPADREGLNDFLEAIGFSSARALVSKALGLSLTDHYWIWPLNSSVSWEKFNFFENSFPEEVGKYLLGEREDFEAFNLLSPDCTTDGCLRKRWIIKNGFRMLLKAGTGPYYQQPFGEVMAYRIADMLEIPTVPYRVIWENDVPYSLCTNLAGKEVELVPAWQVVRVKKKRNGMSYYYHYLNCCKQLGVQGVEKAVDQMMVLDYLIANEDRHYGNFGLLRNPKTLEWIGPAPLWDNGSSFGYQSPTSWIQALKPVKCRPFRNSWTRQLNLVQSTDWFHYERLSSLEPDVFQTLFEFSRYLGETRRKAILEGYKYRAGKLREWAEELEKGYTTDKLRKMEF